jgi:hypothetical protein
MNNREKEQNQPLKTKEESNTSSSSRLLEAFLKKLPEVERQLKEVKATTEEALI